MRTFSALIAIVVLSSFSVSAVPVDLSANVHPTVGNVRAVVDVIHTNLNGAVPRDVNDTVHASSGKINSITARADGDDAVKNIPTVPDNLNSIVPRVNGNGATHRVGTGSRSLKSVIPRAGGGNTLGHLPTVDTIPGSVNSVVPRDGEEPPCEDTQ